MNKINAVLEGIGTKLAPLITLFARVTFGWQIYQAGRGKFYVQGMDKVAGFFESLGIPAPEISAHLAAGAELICGSLLIVGLFTRIATIPLIVTMVVAFLTAHVDDVETFGDFFSQDPITLLAAFLWIFAYGPGPLSLDGLFFKRAGASGGGGTP